MSSNLLQLKNAVKGYASKMLFEDATFAINSGEHVGVIGPNGAGKTTLFKILTGEESLDHGELVKSRDLKLGYLAQEDHWITDKSGREYLDEKCITPIWDLEPLGLKLGLTTEHFDAPLSELSGGYRMRFKLLYMIGMEPNLMLLDEPTNYLDLETLLILEDFLISNNQAFLLISHDREFLRKTTDHILEIEQGSITKYPGNIDDYFEQKELIREQLEKEALSVSAKRKKILDFANRFGAKATKARQAQSKLKQLGKLKEIEVKPLAIGANIRIPPPVRTGKKVLSLKNVDLGYEDTTILKNIHLEVVRGDHIGIVGVNGAGKTTLLKALAGELKPLKEKIDVGLNVDLAYYAQHVSEYLNLDDSVIRGMEGEAHRDVLPQDVLDMAGSLLFSGSAVDKRIGVLSGGEKARVALGRILLKKAPCLILDEPTNHLDFHTVEALAQALQSYEGTVITVSHDRSFIRRVSNKIVEIDNGDVHLYPGTYDEYVWSVEQRQRGVPVKNSNTKSASASANIQKSEGEKVNLKHRRKELKADIRDLSQKAAPLEKKIETAQKRIEELNTELTQKTGAEAGELAKEITNLQYQIVDDESAWMGLLERKEKLEEELKSLD